MNTIRTCIGCRRRAHPGELVRVVASPVEPGFVVGPTAPGRGAWLCRESDTAASIAPVCLAQAHKRKAFARAWRALGAKR